MKTRRVLLCVALICAYLPVVYAQQVTGTLIANGKSAQLKYAIAMEVDSKAEPGYLDVVVVLSDRKLSPRDIVSEDRLAELTTRDGLAAVRLLIDPDAKLKSAAAYHRAFTAFISSGVFARWKPSAYNEKTVAGHVTTDGERNEFNNRWQYDLTFSAPIVLDPEAKTVPIKAK